MAKKMQIEAIRVNEPRWNDVCEWLELVDAIGEFKYVRGASSTTGEFQSARPF